MKNIAKLGVLPVAAFATIAAGTLMNAGSAEAAGLTSGSMTISGILESPLTPAPGTIDFDNAPNAGGFIVGTWGDFSPVLNFKPVTLQDLTYDASGSITASNPFIDFGSVDLFGTGAKALTFVLTGGIFDEVNPIEDSNVDFSGFFKYGDDSIASGTMGFSSAGAANGYTISLTVAEAVPEPATMLGLGLVAGAGFFASRRKQEAEV